MGALAQVTTAPIALMTGGLITTIVVGGAAAARWSPGTATLDEMVRICNDEGLYVSVGPTAIADPQTQTVALEIDRELLLLETDAPVPIGGVAGHPARHP